MTGNATQKPAAEPMGRRITDPRADPRLDAEVLAASNEWSSVPDGAPHVRADDLLVVDA